jgi:hypothetical protein
VDEVTDEPLYRDLVCGIDIGASELALLRVADDPEEVVKIIKEAHTDLEF